MECDENGILTLGDVDPDGKLSVDEGVSLMSAGEEDSSACVICLEHFRVGDAVTWSKEMKCLHVFHHDCIMQWLENPKHDDCPSCRTPILQFKDEEDGSQCDENEDDLELHTSHIAFVVMNGLISRARRASYSLIGSSVKTDDCMPSPPIKLRRVVSEGPVTSHFPADVRHRVPSFRRLPFDSTFGDAESPSLPEDGMLSLRRTVPLSRTVSEGPIYKRAHLFEEPGLFSAGCIAFRRVSSGLYSRLSSTFESAHLTKLDDYDDEDLDDEEDIILPENNICGCASSGELMTTACVDIEMGSPFNRRLM